MNNHITKAPEREYPSSAIPRGLFVTGTDTNVGKTHVTCLIVRQLISQGIRVAAYKPVCSGAVHLTEESRLQTTETISESNVLSDLSRSETAKCSPVSPMTPRWDDIERLSRAICGQWSEETICPQRFLAPLAPPVAAKLEGRRVDAQMLTEGAYHFSDAEILLIEGAGGWLSPLAEQMSVADLACKLSVPVLIVAQAGLGTINHTLLTIESIRARGLVIAGVVLNEVTPLVDDQSWRTNPDEIESRGGVRVFGIVQHGNGLELHRNGQPVTIDWQKMTQQIADREMR